MFNHLTKVGYKSWRAAKNNIASAYNPLKHIVNSIHRGGNWLDKKLNDAANTGLIPHTVVELIRDNPLYSGVMGTINTADALINKDIPDIGNAINRFVEKDIFGHGKQFYDRSTQNMKDIYSSVKNLGNPVRGYTPNRGAYSNLNMGATSAN